MNSQPLSRSSFIALLIIPILMSFWIGLVIDSYQSLLPNQYPVGFEMLKEPAVQIFFDIVMLVGLIGILKALSILIRKQYDRLNQAVVHLVGGTISIGMQPFVILMLKQIS